MPRSRRHHRAPSPRQASAPVSAAGPLLAGRRVASAREWRWRTFPVFFTFAATLFVTSLLSLTLVSWLWLPGALLFAGALSHLVTVYFVSPRLRPRRDR